MNYLIEYIKIDDKVELAYQYIDKNKADSPLVLFLHEGLGSFGQWRNFPEKLCNSLNLDGLVYERYGYGFSTPLKENREPNYLDIEGNYYLPRLIEKLKLINRQIIMVGHSDGASIALIYASLFPENIILLVSMAAHVFNEQISIDSTTMLKKVYQSDDKLKKSLEKYHFSHTDSTFFAFADMITHPEFKNWNIEHYLSNIKAPILAIQGMDDEYGTEKQVDAIVQQSQNKLNHKIMIPNCGHSPHIQEAEFVIENIVKFYTKNFRYHSSIKTYHEKPTF